MDDYVPTEHNLHLIPRGSAARAIASSPPAREIAERARALSAEQSLLGVPTGPHGERTRLSVLPDHPAPFELRWHEREVHSTIPGQYRICVPLRGGPPPSGANGALSRMLDQLWVGEAASALNGPNLSSVVAIIGRGADTGGQFVLTLLLTTDHGVDLDRAHSAAMGRQLRQALDQLGHQA